MECGSDRNRIPYNTGSEYEKNRIPKDVFLEKNGESKLGREHQKGQSIK